MTTWAARRVELDRDKQARVLELLEQLVSSASASAEYDSATMSLQLFQKAVEVQSEAILKQSTNEEQQIAAEGAAAELEFRQHLLEGRFGLESRMSGSGSACFAGCS